MPTRAPRICSCGKLVASGQRCACRRAAARALDAERGTAAQRGYGARWQRESKAFLAEPGHERCACGCGRPADMVDHIRAVKGDMALFWSRSNWQPFARICNTRKAIATEGGFGRPVTSTMTGGRVETSGTGGQTARGASRRVPPNLARGEFDR